MSSLWVWYTDHNHHRHFARVFSKASSCTATAVDVCPRGRAINPLELLSGGSSPSSSASASSASTSSASALASTSASVSQPSSSTSAAGTSMKSTWYSSQNQDFAKIFGLSHVFDFEFRQFHKWYFFCLLLRPSCPLPSLRPDYICGVTADAICSLPLWKGDGTISHRIFFTNLFNTLHQIWANLKSSSDFLRFLFAWKC